MVDYYYQYEYQMYYGLVRTVMGLAPKNMHYCYQNLKMQTHATTQKPNAQKLVLVTYLRCRPVLIIAHAKLSYVCMNFSTFLENSSKSAMKMIFPGIMNRCVLIGSR